MLSEPDISEKECIRLALKNAKTRLEKGELHFQETLSKPTYQNTLKLLRDWDLIEGIHRSDAGLIYRIKDRVGLIKMEKRLHTLCTIE